MHEGSTNNFITGDKFEAKSLFENILAVSPCGSGFCPDPPRSRARKFLGIRILGKVTKKNIETYVPPRISIRSHQSRAAPGGQPRAAIPTSSIDTCLSIHGMMTGGGTVPNSDFHTEPNLSLALRS